MKNCTTRSTRNTTITAKKVLRSLIEEAVEVEPPGMPKSAALGSKPPEWVKV